jgi:hypothetical protein
MKKKGKRMKKFELAKRVKMKIFEKKPQKGGTPAIENKEIIKTFEKKFNDPRSIKDCKVLYSECKN